MLHSHCPSATRVSCLRKLGWFVGVALLSPPATAAEVGHTVVEGPNEPANETSELVTIASDPVAKTALGCAPVILAGSALISPAAPPSATKASAILGGEMSSLERIRLAQSGKTMPSVMLLVENREAEATAENTDYQKMAAHGSRVDICHITPQTKQLPAATSDDKMILGSLRLPIRKTPFDQKWSGVSQAGSKRGLRGWLARTGVSSETNQRMQISLINSWVNGRIAYTDDGALYRQNDFWASSRETLRRGKGDCEDYAILKMDLLAAMGIDREKMILVVARDLVRNADHAVLVVELDGGSVVLDNSTDRLLDGRLPNDYRPIMSFSSNGKWLHGYAVAAVQPQPATPAISEPPIPDPVVTIADLSAPLVPVTVLSVTALAGN